MGSRPDIGATDSGRYLGHVRMDRGSPLLVPRQRHTTQTTHGRRRIGFRRRPWSLWAARRPRMVPLAGRKPGAILFEVNPDRVPGESTVSVSGSEYIRRVKAEIDEIDPSEVRALAGEGVALLDVPESGEGDSGPPP